MNGSNLLDDTTLIDDAFVDTLIDSANATWFFASSSAPVDQVVRPQSAPR